MLNKSVVIREKIKELILLSQVSLEAGQLLRIQDHSENWVISSGCSHVLRNILGLEGQVRSYHL